MANTVNTVNTAALPKVTAAENPVPIAPKGLTSADLMLVVVMSLWGTHYSVAKAAVDVMPPFIYNACRFTIAAVTVGLMLRAGGVKLRLPRREWRSIIWVGFLSFVLYQVFFMQGLHYTVVSHSVLIVTTAPIGIVLLNIARKKERGSARVYTGIVLAVGGVLAVIVTRYAGQLDMGGSTLGGDALTVISAGVWIYNTLAFRRVLEHNPALSANFWTLVWGALFASIIAIPDALSFDWSKVNTGIVLAIIYSGAISIGFGGTLWAVALKRLGSSRASLYLNLQPIIAATVAIIFLGEPFTIWLVIGMCMVLFGMWQIRRG